MSSSAVQYHFVSKTASNLNICVVLHLFFAVLSSVYDPDVSAAIAVMGLIAVLNYNVGLLFLYLFFAPATIIVDIVRMVHVGAHYSKAGTTFFVLLRIAEIFFKIAGTYFGYLVYREASEGDGGYQEINGGPGQNVSGGQPSQPSQPPQPPQQPGYPYAPAPYGAPIPGTGPVVQSIPTSQPQV